MERKYDCEGYLALHGLICDIYLFGNDIPSMNMYAQSTWKCGIRKEKKTFCDIKFLTGAHVQCRRKNSKQYVVLHKCVIIRKRAQI